MIFTADKLKEARDAGYSDDEIWGYASSTDDRFNAAKSEGYSLDEVATFFSSQKPVETSIGDTLQEVAAGLETGVARAGLGFAKGLTGATRSFTDLFGADNPVSKSIAGYENDMDQLMTAEAKKDSQEVARLFKEVEGKGILPQVVAGFEAFTTMPTETVSGAVGYMVPNLAVGLVGKAAQLTKAGMIGTQAAVGALQGAGMMKGQIYSAVTDELRQQGLPEDQVDKVATEAQAYGGKNLDQILLGAGLNALASTTGAEKIMTRILTRSGKEVSEGIIKGAIKGGLAEAPIEFLQGGQEQIAQNLALQREGVDVPLMKDVIPSATMEATAGLLIGGAAGGIEALSPEQKALNEIEKESKRGMRDLESTDPATQAISTELTRLERGIDNKRMDLDTLEATSPEATKMRLDIAADQNKLAALKQQANNLGLSETITEAEKQQIELAKAITAPAAPTIKESLPVAQETPAITPAPVEEVVATSESLVPPNALENIKGIPDLYEAVKKDALSGYLVPAYISNSVSSRNLPKGFSQSLIAKVKKQVGDNPSISEIEDAIETQVEKTVYSKEKKKVDEVKLESALQRTGETYELDVAIQDYKNKQIELERTQKSILTTPALRQIERVGAKNNLEKSKQKLIEIAAKPAPVAETPAVTEAPAAEVAPAIEPLTDDQAETIRDVITLRKSQGREPNPEQVKRLAEYDARKAGVDVQEGDIISNIVVGHPMFEAPQPELSNLVPIKVQNKEQLASPIQRTQQVRDAAQSYIGQYQVEQAKAKTPAQKKAFAKKFNKSELDRQRDILDYIKNDVMPELDRLEKSAPSATPAVSETITPAEPAGKPKLGEKGGVLIPSREDFIQAGQNIYEAGMEFGAWAKQMIQQFGDVVREFLGDVWQAVSGAPAKLNEVMGYLPKKGEAGAVNLGGVKQAKVEREEVMGEKIGPLKKTPEGIIAKTQELLRKKFDPAKVSEQNTTEAFRALGRLTGKDGNAFAQELNDVGRVVDESGAASEISMGAALFVNDLFEYAVRLAASGNKKMLGIMMTNINKLPTAAIGASDAARTLRARLELSQRFLTMAQSEQDAYTNYVAEFIYGPNPTKEQIKSIKDAYAAVEKTPQVTEQELTDEIKAVGDRSGTDLVGKINEEFTKTTEKGKEKRKTEEAELDIEYKKIQRQADAEIEKLAKIQSDTPSFDPAAARQITNDVRAIVANDLKQRPDMGRKAPWKSLLVAKLQEAGVEVAAAETLADIVWRQHEINSLSRELSSIDKAIEKGPISEIVKAIKDTPLEDQQNPNWRYEVMRDYLRKAGLPLAQAERIAKLMDISLQKRFTMAQEQAFTDAISKTAPWKAGDTRSRRAFQKVLQALRAGALDPARNVLSDMAALNGWTGFSPEQYKTLLKNDAILADPKSGELKKAEAYKAIQDVISKAKLPIRARDVIGQYYDAQALSGIPTLTVNAFSPIAFALRNTLVEIGSGTLKGNPKAITNAATALVDSIKSWANTVAFSFKNNVTVYSNVDYIVNDDNLLRLYRKGVDQFTKGKTPRDKADGIKNMMVGIMDYVRRMLNALDYGAIASLQNQNISKYSMAVMKRQGMSTKKGNEMFAVMMKAKNDFYLQQIAIGTDKNKASILADEFYISSWSEALTKAGVENSDIKQAMDAAINDALSSVGRNRQSIDALKDESTKLKDAGVSSMPALWLLESMASAANQTESQILKLFSRVIYGFAIVPARVIRETAWFSPYGFVRFGYDAIAKRMGKTSPYAQSLGTDVQYSQRLNEAIAGTVALTALFALRAGSTDEPEEDDFKIVFTGNGPQRKDDPQFYDSWYKAGNKPNTMSVYFGKSKFDLNMMRGFEAFTWPAMMLGALDDLEIRKKQKQQTKTSNGIEDASIVAGFVFDAALRRGPYAFTTKSLFGTYGDIGVEGVAKGLTFPAKTLIPVLGTSLASNLSNFINDPIDRRTLDGAVWSNIPFIGPAVAPKSLNAFGEPSLSTDMASKMFKLGVPIVYDIPTDRESIKLHELVLKQGGGPSIPTRNQLAQRLDRQPTNKEYEMFVREYGTVLTTSMKKNYDKLFNAKPEFYSKAVERIGNRARDVAENKVRVAAKKP